MFESRISAGPTDKLPGWEEAHAKTVGCFCDMEGDAKKCVQRYGQLANKKTGQLFKVSTPCLDDHNFKKEELEMVGELSKSAPADGLEMLVFGPELIDLTFFGL